MSHSTVEVGESAFGRGVFASAPFQPGQPLLVFTGRVLSHAESWRSEPIKPTRSKSDQTSTWTRCLRGDTPTIPVTQTPVS